MFEKITIEFKGDELEVPANKVFGLIAEIEEHITLPELHSKPKNTAIASAYAAAIRYAGGKATTFEVYEMLFDMEGALNIRNAINNLVMMMVPPSALQQKGEVEDVKKKPKKQS